ncbi:LytR/AlgR family response regulator transcription factor [Flavitalea sp.]|nr:LytTR family DNA-binding domain-containing protein [Flavitalea sp.]
MRIYNCVVVDDEPIAREIVMAYCNHLPALKMIAACNNALEAKQVLEEKNTDILFLDINMPVLSGLAFLKTLKNPPQIIFTTAYREYAVDAFDLSAADYLLKPFSLERFIVAVDKAIEKLTANNNVQNLSPSSEIKHNPAIFIKADGKIYKLVPDEILYAEASGNYSKVVASNYSIMPAMSFTALVTMLNYPEFIRVHRSFIINKTHIKLIDGNRVFIRSHEIPIGSSYKEEFIRQLGI